MARGFFRSRYGLSDAVAAARALSGNGPVSIVLASSEYADVLTNWIGFARRAGTENVLVVALDAVTGAVARAHDVSSVTLTGISDRSALWVTRALLFAELASAGVDFIHSDADAIWLRSPFEDVLSLDVDIVFSSGTVWPPAVAERWGFVVCCGFFFSRGGPAAADFFTDVAARARACRDDQIAVNEALVARSLVWDVPHEGQTRSHEGQTFRVFADTIVGRAASLRVAVLPQARFTRLAEVTADTVVAHPVTLWDEGVNHTQRLSRALGQLGLWAPAQVHPVRRIHEGSTV